MFVNIYYPTRVFSNAQEYYCSFHYYCAYCQTLLTYLGIAFQNFFRIENQLNIKKVISKDV